MRTSEKVFCNLTEYYYFKGLSVIEAMNASAKLLRKERGYKNE